MVLCRFHGPQESDVAGVELGDFLQGSDGQLDEFAAGGEGEDHGTGHDLKDAGNGYGSQ